VIRTPVCDLLGITVPVVAAPFGPWEQVDLAAAVSRAGGLGSVGTALRSPDDLRDQWRRLRSLTDRPFAVNHQNRPFDEAAFAATLAARPKVISFHICVPADLVARAHDAGILWMQQVMDRHQAEDALAAGADVIIAQGGEAGGHGGWVSTLVLVTETVALAGDVPVLAAGGIAGGAGLAAALALGAQGVSMGTRFLASTEAGVHHDWKRRVVDAQALDAVKVVNSDPIMPPYTRSGVRSQARALETPLITVLRERPDDVDPAVAGPELIAAIRAGRGDQFLPFTGQSAALIHEILPAAEILRRTVANAELALQRAMDTTGRTARPTIA
jgi:enoyl-[acyl-carrier protein] reductase II